MEVMQSFAQDLYSQQAAEGGADAAGDPASGSESKKSDDDAVDADFEVVDDDKK
jgi:hypothetical protein